MYKKTKNVVLAGLFIALGLILPFFTAQVPTIGSRLLPMHIPVLLSGFVCGPQTGLVVGLVTPLLRSLLFGMPPLFPTATAMALELAAYGFLTGYLRRLSPLTALIAAMLGGRIVWGFVSFALYGLRGSTFTWPMFIAGGFVNALPGIIVQIVLIPVLVTSLRRANYIGR